jgi:hypothetical protein
MNKIRVNGFIRISKQAAKKRYEAQQLVVITPCKCAPGNKWCIENRMFNVGGRTFDQYVNEWSYYNCNSELGRYPAFYVKEA